MWDDEATTESLRSFLVSRGARPEMLDDIVNETWVRVAANPPQRPDYVLSYAMSTARNVMLDMFRKGNRFVQEDPLEILGKRGVSDDHPSDSDSGHREVAIAAFKQLSDRHRHIIWDVEVEGLTVAEVSRKLGLSNNATAALLYQARNRLRKEFDREMDIRRGTRPARLSPEAAAVQARAAAIRNRNRNMQRARQQMVERGEVKSPGTPHHEVVGDVLASRPIFGPVLQFGGDVEYEVEVEFEDDIYEIED